LHSFGIWLQAQSPAIGLWGVAEKGGRKNHLQKVLIQSFHLLV